MKLTSVLAPPPSVSVFLLLVICFLSSFIFTPPSIDFEVHPISSSPSPHSHSNSHSRSSEAPKHSPAAVIDLELVDNGSSVDVEHHDIPKVCPPGAVQHDGHACEVVEFNPVDEEKIRRKERNGKNRKTGEINLKDSKKKQKKKAKKEKIRGGNERSSVNPYVKSQHKASNVATVDSVSMSKSSSPTVQGKSSMDAVKNNFSPSFSNETETSSSSSQSPQSASQHLQHSSPSTPPNSGHAATRKMIKYSVIPLHEDTSHVYTADHTSSNVRTATTSSPIHSSKHMPTPSTSASTLSTSNNIPAPSNEQQGQFPQPLCPPGYTRREDGHPDECALTPSRALTRKHTRPYLTLPGCPLGYIPTNATTCACEVDEAGRDDSACLRPLNDNGEEMEMEKEEQRVMLVMTMPRTECPLGFSYRHGDRVCVRCPHYFELAHRGRVCVQKVVVEAV